MKNDQLPEGFLAEREGDTVRVTLPEVVVTGSHVLEPMLTRGAAQRLAEALWEADVDAPIGHIVLVRDPRLGEPAVERFRERLLGLFIEGGMDAEVEIEVDREAGSSASSAPATDEVPAAAAEPPAGPTAEPAPISPAAPTSPPEPTPPPAPASPPAPGSPAKKAFVAPVPTRRKLGSPRSERGGDEP
jgi:hypothetical protein